MERYGKAESDPERDCKKWSGEWEREAPEGFCEVAAHAGHAKRKMGDKGVMLWATACLCFFGCLRAGEALAPEKREFNPKVHLGWEDVELEDIRSLSKIRVRIKES